MQTRRYKWIIGCLIVSNLVTLVWLWPGSRRSSSSSSAGKAESHGGALPMSILPPRMAPRDGNHKTGATLPNVPESVVRRIRLDSVTLDPATGHLRLSEEFEWLAGVTPEESGSVDACFRRFAARFQELEMQQMETIAASEDFLEVRISALGEEEADRDTGKSEVDRSGRAWRQKLASQIVHP